MANIEMNVLKVGDSEFEIADAQARQDCSDLKDDFGGLEDVLEIPTEEHFSATSNNAWTSTAIGEMPLTNGVTYTFNFNVASAVETGKDPYIYIKNATSGDNIWSSSIAVDTTSKEFVYICNSDDLTVRFTFKVGTSDETTVNVDVTTNEVGRLDRIENELNAVVKETASVKQGSPITLSKPASYYVHSIGIDFKNGDTVTAREGYEFGLYNSAGALLQAWTTSYTFASDVTQGKIVVRKTGADEEIDISTDGKTLRSYIYEDYISISAAYFGVGLTDGAILDTQKQMGITTTNSKWTNKKAAFIGDSITYGVNTSTGNIYYQLLNNMIGFSEVYADGVAGSCYSSQSNYGTSVTPIVDRWANIPTDRDLVVIFAGTNDWGHNTPLGTIADTTDISFYGAISVVINGILEANPDTRLVLFTPLHRYGYTTGDYPNDTNENGQGHTLKEYVDAIKEIAQLYSIPVIDLFSISGLNPRISAIKTDYITDGLHPNAAGHKLLAQRIEPQLETL